LEKELFDYLSKYLTENKLKKILDLSEKRTKYLTIALEDIYQPHNASAVVRSCEGFGVQNLHIIENKNKYRLNPDVMMGASKWVSMNRYNATDKNNSETVIKKLKKEGYRIVATTPHTDQNIEDLDVENGKIALFFGKEDDGLSDYVLENADERIKIPMYGFTESFNISVSAALCMHYLGSKIRHSGAKWKLDKEEIEELRLNWAKKVVKNSEILIKNYIEEKK
jgi:tRNA (guanosine-2'-O-)-methyltransferase